MAETQPTKVLKRQMGVGLPTKSSFSEEVEISFFDRTDTLPFLFYFFYLRVILGMNSSAPKESSWEI